MPLRILASLALLVALAACAAQPQSQPELLINGVPASQIVPGYGQVEDDGYVVPPVPPGYLGGVNRRAQVAYTGTEPPGTIEIDPHAKFLYWVEAGGTAIRYPIAVGREGKGISGSFSIARKAEWPGWTPTANMLRTEPEVYGRYAGGVPGGFASPLGARALYLYRGSRDTYYRVHGTNDLSSIGNEGSAGCIRLFNQDAIDLFNRVPTGTRVAIRTLEDSVRIEGPLMAERGIELPPFYLHGDGAGDGQRPPVSQAMIPEQYYGNPAAQVGVGYVPDPTDAYPAEGLTGEATPPRMAPLPATSGIEMVDSGYVANDGTGGGTGGVTVSGDTVWPAI